MSIVDCHISHLMTVNTKLAPCLPARTGRTPEYKACWEEPPTTEEMTQVMRLLKEITDLSVQKLT